MNEQYIPIHAFIWNPKTSFFKSAANDTAYCEVYYCSIPSTCPLLKAGQCINDVIFGSKCPFGHKTKENGPTKRSKKCSEWVRDKKEKFGQYKQVKGNPSKKMIVIGDYVYLPYSFIDMNTGVPFLKHSHFFSSGQPFISIGSFVQSIKKIVDFKPQAMIGGEITEYQKTSVPQFLVHLQEVFPDYYKQLITDNPEYVARYNLSTKDYVGRKAILRTINPCEVAIDKNVFTWDGVKLVSKVFDTLWINVKDTNDYRAIEKIDVVIVPTDKAITVITNNSQVNQNTIFVD